MTFESLQGVIRDGQPLITASHAEGVSEKTITFQFMRGKQQLGVIHRRWPSDFAIDGDAGCGATNLDGAEAFEPYSAVMPLIDGVEIAPPGWGLTRLYPRDEADFEAIFFKARHRPADSETLFFATNQVFDHYRANESHRCVATVIQGYKAIELNRPELADRAISTLKTQLTLAPTLPASWRARLDGVHLMASIHSVLWQIYLYSGQFDAVVLELDALVGFLKAQPNAMSTILINGCPAILVRAHLLMAEGRKDEAVALARFNADFYVSGLHRMKRLRKLFNEMVPPHKLVVTSLDLAERAERGDDGLDELAVIRQAQRVDSSLAGAKVMQDQYRQLCRQLRARRRRLMRSRPTTTI